ncbi:MAG: ABC transporter permease [Candidatus Cloacimonetes bacterium]|jgi:putative ABC transport system permease protein|nr:ABC transporter permease [Candidatus Cloacimonadota bacterium]MBT6994762.1 ABC transporter permease [Candidatus Cloacimonadota bacterium]MBT7469460.1 ABC transporter permease [Candidatus Cloacimonadota bacterium]
MRLLKIAYKNLKRKKIRSLLTIGGVSVAVAVLVSLLGFNSGYQLALNNDVDKMGYQVLVTAKGCPYEAATLMLKGGGGMRYMEENVYNRIVQDERIDQITPQLMTTVYNAGKEGGGGFTMYMGILDSYLVLKPWSKFESGSWFSSEDADEVIIGYEAAELEQREVGDMIFIPGKEQILKVVGIFERTGTQDDGVIFMPLKSTQRIFELPNQITGIGIKLKKLSDLMQFEEDLYDEASIQVISMAQVKGTIMGLISSAQILVTSVAIIAIFVAIVGVINTILMSVFERTQEIGVMKAIGASNLDIFQLIWYETIFICLIGGVLGSVMAVLAGNLVEYFVKALLPYAPAGKLIYIDAKLILSTQIGAVVLGLISGVYPAFRAANMRPIEAIRSGE